MLKVNIKHNLEQKSNQLINVVRKATKLENFANAPSLPDLLGQCVQRTIDAQKFKPLNPKYRIVRVKKFGNRPILRLTDALYKRALLPGFFRIAPSSNFRVLNVKISDLIGNYQQALGRDIFKPDQKLRNDLADLAQKEIAKKLKNEF